jgi:hypothetical protein
MMVEPGPAFDRAAFERSDHHFTKRSGDMVYANAPRDNSVAQNAYDLRSEYGPTDFDRRHVFTASYIYELPFHSSRGSLPATFIEGWRLSGASYISTGRPVFIRGLNPPIDPAGLGFFAPNEFAVPRPDQISDPNTGAPHSVQEWFNTAAFGNPLADGLRPGNAPPRALYGPGEIRWDAAILKDTNVGERTSLQFRVEATNVLNHTNFDYVVPDFGSLQFGQVLSARDPRIITLGIKLNF